MQRGFFHDKDGLLRSWRWRRRRDLRQRCRRLGHDSKRRGVGGRRRRRSRSSDVRNQCGQIFRGNGVENTLKLPRFHSSGVTSAVIDRTWSARTGCFHACHSPSLSKPRVQRCEIKSKSSVRFIGSWRGGREQTCSLYLRDLDGRWCAAHGHHRVGARCRRPARYSAGVDGG